MVIKGSSRGGPKQLARHLQRTDTNERVEILESGGPGSLAETFSDMQLLTTGTKGRKGLYHANIDPHGDYEMTSAQWDRCVEVLEQELGLQGQPRTVVLHEKHGRTHIHVVWARTDIETMTLRSDSQNYAAHERASLQLEQEFGHELTPGRHAKRDRSKPLPRAAFNHAAWQQAERTGIDPRERQADLTRLYHRCDTGKAFQTALEERGYTLAQGKRRSLVLVDSQGEIHSLSRQITDTPARLIKAKLRDLDFGSLPRAEDAKVLVRAFSPKARKQEPSRSPHETVQPEPGETARGPYSEARNRLAAEHQALLERHREEADRAESRWLAAAEREMQRFDAALERRRQAEDRREAQQSRRRFPFMREAPKPPAPEPRPPRRATWRFNPERSQELLRQRRAREAWRDRRDAQQRAEKLDETQRQIAAQREVLVDRQAFERAELEERLAEERGRLEREEARLTEIRRQREAEERERTRHELTRDGPGRNRGRDR